VGGLLGWSCAPTHGLNTVELTDSKPDTTTHNQDERLRVFGDAWECTYDGELKLQPVRIYVCVIATVIINGSNKRPWSIDSAPPIHPPTIRRRRWRACTP